ncbi:MAG: helix-turn-helix domain-containing protein [Candidatus Omnitrophica bacterium]|nr:helix-turn-helix domain-containing protein [Candidatus Omnitrophota bacterium]
MDNKDVVTIAQLAKMLGISRIAVYKKVKKGQIKAIKIGKTYAIPTKNIPNILGKVLSQEQKRQIDEAVAKTVREYGETLKLLGKE